MIDVASVYRLLNQSNTSVQPSASIIQYYRRINMVGGETLGQIRVSRQVGYGQGIYINLISHWMYLVETNARNACVHKVLLTCPRVSRVHDIDVIVVAWLVREARDYHDTSATWWIYD